MLGEKEQTFFTVKDLSANEFVAAFAQHLKKNNLIERPNWVDYVKLSTKNELAPLDEDWIYYRVAALARKIYLRPRTGVRLLSHFYGGKIRVSSRPPRHETAGTKVIRWGLQQLEKNKIIKKDTKDNVLKLKSRIVSKEGRAILNRIATEHIKSKKN
eukprot:TRINITY_DN6350_c0_g1_i1.p1 TRINITY_DN6350_c0_g1~~TRINITY_DN6350_c0_g1_i1.p1  ORF type:complete len:157 (+),score=16.85 TRINITY_DN6350_c0_g1_i1:19-489(+)